MTTTASTHRRGGWLVLLLAAVLTAALAVLLAATNAGIASAATVSTGGSSSAVSSSAAGTRVGVSSSDSILIVGVGDHIAAGQGRGEASSQCQLVSGCCVAAVAGGARFVVGASGETTMYLRAGSESLEVTEHAALRMTQRGISIDEAESTLSQPSFQYFHQGVWKTGYYDPSSRIFIGTVDGQIRTVIGDATPKYIQNLQAAAP